MSTEEAGVEMGLSAAGDDGERVTLALEDVRLLSSRGFFDSSQIEPLWDAMCDRSRELHRHKGPAGTTCFAVAAFAGVALVMLGAYAASTTCWLFGLHALALTIVIVLLIATGALALLLHSVKQPFFAGMAFFCAHLIFLSIGVEVRIFMFNNADTIGVSVWYPLLCGAVVAVNLVFVPSPIVSIAAYVCAYAEVAGVLMLALEHGAMASFIVIIVVFVLLESAMMVAGIVLDRKPKTEPYALWAFVSSLMGLFVTLSMLYMRFWVAGWPMYVAPLTALAAICAGWMLGYTVFQVSGVAQLLLWVAYAVWASPWANPFVVSIVLCATGLLAVLCAFVYAKSSDRITRFLHAKLPPFLFAASARRRWQYAEIQSDDVPAE